MMQRIPRAPSGRSFDIFFGIPEFVTPSEPPFPTNRLSAVVFVLALNSQSPCSLLSSMCHRSPPSNPTRWCLKHRPGTSLLLMGTPVLAILPPAAQWCR